MAWGTPAGKRVQKIDQGRHLVLKSVHPSPLSASRGFFDCGHFKKANTWLVDRYGEEGEIDWALAPGTSTKATAAVATKQNEKGAEDVATEIDLEEDEEALAEAIQQVEQLEERAKKGD